MKSSKLTHKMACFYILLKQHQEDRIKYISPSTVDIGDVYIEETKEYIFTTWKTPTRLTDIFQENPGLLERISVKSKAGQNYYKYRLNINFTEFFIQDPKLKEFFKKISPRYIPQEIIEEKTCPHGLPAFVKCPYCI